MKALKIILLVLLILLALAGAFCLVVICASLGNDLSFVEQLQNWFGTGILSKTILRSVL